MSIVMSFGTLLARAAALVLGGSAIATASATPIAYLALTDGYWEAWSCEPDGTNPMQVTRFGADAARISWFPDGKRLFVDRHDGRWFEVDLASREAKELQTPLPGIVDGVLSPDGKAIAFSLSTGDSIDDNDLWLYEFASQRTRKLTQMPRLQHEPVWSPDGRYVYFLSGDGGQAHDIWRVETTSAATEQLTVNDLYHFDLAVRADGALAYSSNRSGNYELWVQGPGQAPKQLTFDPGLDARPSWDPAGTALVFESTRSGEAALYRITLDDGNIALLPLGRAARLPVFFHAQEDAP
jgi:TolB protein